MLEQAFTVVGTQRADVDRPAVAQDFLGAIVCDIGDGFVIHTFAVRLIGLEKNIDSAPSAIASS
jgi:hypothetical protein